MQTVLLSLLPLLALSSPVDGFAILEPVPAAQICIENDGQRPMMGDPHGPPLVCLYRNRFDLFLKHGSCRLPSCQTHVPVEPGVAPPTLVLGLSVTCPLGDVVEAPSYRLPGKAEVPLLGSGGGNDLDLDFEVAPFSAAEVASGCEQALGGSWLVGGAHSNPQAGVETELKKTIEVRSRCSSETEVRKKSYSVTLEVTCHDRDFGLF